MARHRKKKARRRSAVKRRVSTRTRKYRNRLYYPAPRGRWVDKNGNFLPRRHVKKSRIIKTRQKKTRRRTRSQRRSARKLAAYTRQWSRSYRRLAIRRARRRIRELLAEGAMKGVREERAYIKRLQKR